MITVRKLARAIERRLGVPSEDALAQSKIVLSYFGFRNVIIDNAISPEDRKVFYALHDARLLQSWWETVSLLDGRTWRIFYWAIDEADVERVTREQAPPEEGVYRSLPDEAWSHTAFAL